MPVRVTSHSIVGVSSVGGDTSNGLDTHKL